jgi:hypothetical protein
MGGTMKIQIEQDITGTGTYIWGLEDGPEHIDKFSGFADTLGECFEEIIRHQTINAIGYVYE